MTIVERFVQGPSACPYLPERQCRMEYLVASKMTGREYEKKMNANWRKFGHLLFHPICESCTECRSLRVRIDQFQPSRSQRRAVKENADLRVAYDLPILDDARLNLYWAYHVTQHERKQWSKTAISPQEYEFSYVQNPVSAVEISAWKQDRLVGVLIADVTPGAVSAVYHYYDLSEPQRGLGTFLIMQAFALARQQHKSWMYFGYYVPNSASMKYKATYRPYQLLQSEGNWVSAEAVDPALSPSHAPPPFTWDLLE
jgi:arginine-tRNA-protein transferase